MLQKKMLSKVGSAVFCLATVLSLQVLWCSTASAQVCQYYISKSTMHIHVAVAVQALLSILY